MGGQERTDCHFLDVKTMKIKENLLLKDYFNLKKLLAPAVMDRKGNAIGADWDSYAVGE